MNWGELFLILVTYCGSSSAITNVDQCRNERIPCFKRVAASEYFKNDAVQGISGCLSDPNFKVPAPSTATSPSPSPKAGG